MRQGLFAGCPCTLFEQILKFLIIRLFVDGSHGFHKRRAREKKREEDGVYKRIRGQLALARGEGRGTAPQHQDAAESVGVPVLLPRRLRRLLVVIH